MDAGLIAEPRFGNLTYTTGSITYNLAPFIGLVILAFLFRIFSLIGLMGGIDSFNDSSYGAPSSSYGAPSSGYGAPSSDYGAPASSYGAPASGYGAPASGYGAPASGYNAPSSSFGSNSFGSNTANFGAPSFSNVAPAVSNYNSANSVTNFASPSSFNSGGQISNYNTGQLGAKYGQVLTSQDYYIAQPDLTDIGNLDYTDSARLNLISRLFDVNNLVGGQNVEHQVYNPYLSTYRLQAKSLEGA